MSTPASTPDGLLSLSLAAASAAPIPIVREPSQDSCSYGGLGSLSLSGKPYSLQKHRRLSSSNHARRLSDAREAASRPSPATIQSAAAALNSLADLSLSGSPPPQSVPQPSISFVSASGHLQASPAQPIPITTNRPKVEQEEEIDLGSFDSGVGVKAELSGAGISVSSKGGNGKKRSTIFKCETCAKVYRHPSCLIKHRWEHSPHWREASKFLLSKHQQVQLLEAAAILSHLAPSARGGTSLPEDRSLWPSYLSGGILPPPNTENMFSDAQGPLHSVPRSVSRETSARPSSAASRPRLHDYAIPGAGVTHVRPGVVSVPTGSVMSTSPPELATAPVSAPVPVPVLGQRDGLGFSFVSGPSDAWSSPVSLGFAQSSFRSSALSHSFAESAGWSLPRSSVRSSSRSRSGSVSEGEFIDVEGEDDVTAHGYGFTSRSLWRGDAAVRSAGVGQDKIEEEWDGMEMEMEM